MENLALFEEEIHNKYSKKETNNYDTSRKNSKRNRTQGN
jgi:hypothetical protein